jgi:fructosamine-3-kinase
MSLQEAVAAAISEASGLPFRITSQSAVGGGDINESHRLDGADGRRYFLKLNAARYATMLAAEAAGLAAIAATQTIRVPQVIAQGSAAGQAFLVLEHLELRGRGDERLLGEQLAAMHRCTADAFGFAQDNFIGTTPQPNGWKDDWIIFWREQRLGYQLQLAARKGHGGELQALGERLLDALPAFFDGYTPQPSLLHGDLWGGNHGFLTDGTPLIFDPAVYYGDRECDIAMSELFGGYGSGFYAAYRAAWPLHEGYARRRELYNLYHILNHVNLFGGDYARQAEGMMRSLLAGL